MSRTNKQMSKARQQAKSQSGRYFEDFDIGQRIRHASPLSVTQTTAGTYKLLTGLRFSTQCSRPFAEALGFADCPLDDVLVYKIVFGQSVPDISMRAVATLGYGGCLFGTPVFPGDTIRSESEVIGLQTTDDESTGVVYVRTSGFNQNDEQVVSFVRWVSVRRKGKGDPIAAPPPPLPESVVAKDLVIPKSLSAVAYDREAAGSPFLWDDYEAGESIDHVDGFTVDDSEALMAARLYQNVAPPHVNAHLMESLPFGKRIVFVGHVVGLARSISYNGLANLCRIAAINRALHLHHIAAGTTVYAWSEVIERMEIPGRRDLGALRIRTVATENRTCHDFPYRDANGNYDESVILDWDYVGLIPRRT